MNIFIDRRLELFQIVAMTKSISSRKADLLSSQVMPSLLTVCSPPNSIVIGEPVEYDLFAVPWEDSTPRSLQLIRNTKNNL